MAEYDTQQSLPSKRSLVIEQGRQPSFFADNRPSPLQMAHFADNRPSPLQTIHLAFEPVIQCRSNTFYGLFFNNRQGPHTVPHTFIENTINSFNIKQLIDFYNKKVPTGNEILAILAQEELINSPDYDHNILKGYYCNYIYIYNECQEYIKTLTDTKITNTAIHKFDRDVAEGELRRSIKELINLNPYATYAWNKVEGASNEELFSKGERSKNPADMTTAEEVIKNKGIDDACLNDMFVSTTGLKCYLSMIYTSLPNEELDKLVTFLPLESQYTGEEIHEIITSGIYSDPEFPIKDSLCFHIFSNYSLELFLDNESHLTPEGLDVMRYIIDKYELHLDVEQNYTVLQYQEFFSTKLNRTDIPNEVFLFVLKSLGNPNKSLTDSKIYCHIIQNILSAPQDTDFIKSLINVLAPSFILDCYISNISPIKEAMSNFGEIIALIDPPSVMQYYEEHLKGLDEDHDNTLLCILGELIGRNFIINSPMGTIVGKTQPNYNFHINYEGLSSDTQIDMNPNQTRAKKIDALFFLLNSDDFWSKMENNKIDTDKLCEIVEFITSLPRYSFIANRTYQLYEYLMERKDQDPNYDYDIDTMSEKLEEKLDEPIYDPTTLDRRGATVSEIEKDRSPREEDRFLGH